MSSTLSPNMSLIIPTVGSEAGPQYATDVNNSLTILDGHDHSPGSGVQINPGGMNINTALSFQGNAATNLSYANFIVTSTFTGATGSVYVKNGTETPVALPDLWYFDGTNNIQITSGGNVNAALTSLPGQSYSAGPPGTFIWKQGAGSSTPANFDIGSITIRPLINGTTFGVQLSAPSSGNATLVLPSTLPGSQSFMTLDASGNIAAPISTSGGITRSNLAAVGQQISSSSGNFTTSSNTPTNVTNLTVTITTSGRPVMVMLNSDGTANGSLLANGTGNTAATFQISRGVTAVAFQSIAGTTTIAVPCSSLMHLDTPSAGTYTYTVQAQVTTATAVQVNKSVLVVYEL